MRKIFTGHKRHLIQIPFLLTALILFVSSLAPILLLPNQASALGQLTVRSLTISSGQSAATNVIYTYGFTTATLNSIQSIKFVACTAATATYGMSNTASTSGCTAPSGMNINQGTQQGTNTFTNTTAFTRVTSSTGVCTPAANVLCINRTQAANETVGAKTVAWNTQTNPTVSGNGTTFYVGIYTYSDNSFTGANAQDSGTVASAVVPALQVTAAVAELLVFCIGSTSVDDATTAIGSASSCSGTTVDLGTLDPTAINYSKTNGNNLNGVAIMRTNAINGSAVYYDSIQDTDSGTGQHGDLKIQGVNCVGGSNPNPNACITSKASQGVFTAGTSDFGMTIAGTNCGTASAYYACVFTSGTEHLKAQAPYIGNTTSAFCSPTNCNSNNGFIWDDTGASDKIAAAAANNVVADEALILKFAATPSITNTFGSYSVKVDFTAVPTF